MHGSLRPARQQLVEHRVNRCDASAASDHDDRSLRVFAQIERAEWAFQPQDRALRHLVGCRSEEHTSELQSLMRISYAVFCLKKKKHINIPLLQRYAHSTSNICSEV